MKTNRRAFLQSLAVVPLIPLLKPEGPLPAALPKYGVSPASTAGLENVAMKAKEISDIREQYIKSTITALQEIYEREYIATFEKHFPIKG